MTVKEYISLKLKQLQASYNEELLEALFLRHGVDGSKPYDKTTARKADLMLYYILPEIIAVMPTSVSEGGYSVSRTLEGLLKLYDLLCNELGLENKLNNKAKVKDITKRW